MAAAYYFIDYTNGNDSRTGLRIPAGNQDSTSYYTIDSVPDTTHFVDSALTGADNYISGSYVWNVTKSQGRIIDAFDSGSDRVQFGVAMSPIWEAGDSYYILDSWKTINKYTTTTVRTAGDAAYLRANMTHTQGAANISSDESGTASARVSLWGCNITQGIDPWHDNSDNKPVVDFNAGAYYAYLTNSYWHVKNIRFYNTSATYIVRPSASVGLLFENLVIDTVSGANAYCLQATYCGNSTFRGIVGSNSTTTVFGLLACWSCKFEDFGTVHCSADNGALGTNYGLGLIYGNKDCIIENMVFAAGGNFDTSCISTTVSDGTLLRNCTYNGTKSTIPSTGGIYRDEDVSGTFGDAMSGWCVGTVQKCATGLADTTVRTGGAVSARLIPNTNVGPYFPLSINSPRDSDFLVWCPALATTITVYMRAYGTWSTYPTASELWIDAEYLSSTSPITRTTSTASTQVLSDTTTWVAFTTTFTPAQASWVDVKVKLAKYQDANTGVYVDIRPVVS